MVDRRHDEPLISLLSNGQAGFTPLSKQWQIERIMAGQPPDVQDEPVVNNLLIRLSEALSSEDLKVAPAEYSKAVRLLLRAKAEIIRLKFNN